MTRRARRREGPCAPLFFAAAALLLLSAGLTNAQTADLSSLEICASLETSELKLACFEAIIAAGEIPDEQAVEDSAAPHENDIGQEIPDVPERTQEKIIRATVVAVSQGYSRKLTFRLANGQVWRQIEARYLQYPKDGDFDINITQGMMGEYRLRIGDDGQMVRIKRVK
jgi:hypothetical protein